MAQSGKSRVAALRNEQLAHAVTVGRFSKYEDAQGAVDLLADRGFPVQNLAIVGSDLRQVEHVVGTLSYARVAGSGALQGLFYGVMLGFLLTLFGHETPLAAFLTTVPLGIAFWMILAVVGYSRRGGQRSFTAVGQLVAGSYDLVCAPQEAGEARRLLGGSSNRTDLRPRPERAPQSGAYGGQPNPGWNDPRGGAAQHPQHTRPGGAAAPPVGQRDPQAGQQDPQAAGDDQGRAGESGDAETPQRTQARDYKDLPDGRPRFGLRADDAEHPDSSGGSSSGSSNNA